MTTKTVVADDIVGRVARRQHDVMRRLLEGSLEPRKVLAGLQLIAEGMPVPYDGGHAFEDLPFVMSEKNYKVNIDRDMPPRIGAVKAGLNTEQWSRELDEKVHISSDGPEDGVYQLARFFRGASFAEARTLLLECGFVMTDIWELIAFAEVFHGIRYPSESFAIWALASSDGDLTCEAVWCVHHTLGTQFHPKEIRPFNSGIRAENARDGRYSRADYVLVRRP